MEAGPTSTASDIDKTVPNTPIPSLDESGAFVLHLAAALGVATSDDVFVSFTTLIIALVLAETPVCRVLRSEIEEGRVPWSVEEMLAVHGPAREEAERIALEMPEPLSVPLPSGRPILSVSARNVLGTAEAVAARRGFSAISDVDILTAYLFHSPADHVEQMKRWAVAPSPDWFPHFANSVKKIAGPLPQEWQDALSVVSSKAGQGESIGQQPTPEPLDGFDEPATALLRLAFMLARCTGKEPAVLGSGALLVAAVEGGEGGEAAVLRELLRAERNLRVYEQARDKRFEGWAETLTDTASLTELPQRTRGAEAIIETARDFAARAKAPQRIGLRHLIVAQLVNPNGTDRTSIGEWLSDDDVSRARESLARVIGDNYPGQRAFWQDLLVGRDRPFVTKVQADTVPDDPRKADMLGLRRYSDAIAALIAATDQHPPLSIAVFGPWGSGKSFFMAMVRAAVRDFSRPRAGKDQGRPLFVSRIAQIEFNAWHYVEGNLWASLVHAVLEKLQQELSPPGADGKPFQDLLGELSLRQAAEAVALDQLHQAEQREAEAGAALEEAKRQEDARGATLNRIRANDVLGAFRTEALGRLRSDASEDNARAWIKNIGSSVSKAADYLGRPDLKAELPALERADDDDAAAAAALQVQIGKVQEVLTEASASARQGAALLAWLGRADIAPGAIVKLVIGGGFLFLALLAVASGLEHYGARIAAMVAALTSVLVPAAAGLTAFANWARRHVAEASGAFAVLDGLRERIEAARTERVSQHEAELHTAQRAATEAQAERARRDADLKAAQTASEQARHDLKAAGSAEQMKRFVAQRLADGDYLRHLGLVHIIRGDMEKLGGLLNQVQPKIGGLAPPIERIVLYIDDLDRCPPTRVVEVLEAVHLLLAFPLFVVVVGVDIRWVSQALHRRYPQQLAGSHGIASPLDYLEKVFQIPFWLPPMNHEGSRKLLDAAIGASPPADASTASGDWENVGGARDKKTSDTAGQQRFNETGAGSSSRSVLSATVNQFDTASTGTTVSGEEAAADALVLTAGERSALLDMATAIGISPRRAKRFANLYRLLKASLSVAERRHFVLEDGAGGSYRGALILLAAATGAPDTARTVVRRLINTEVAPPGADGRAQLASLLAGIEPTPGEKPAFRAAEQYMVHAADPDELLRHLRFWAPRVGRFIFQGLGD